MASVCRPSACVRASQQGGVGLLLQHHPRAARREGSRAAGRRGRAPLAREPALGGRVPTPRGDDRSLASRQRRSLTMPGLSATVGEQIAALARAAARRARSFAASRIRRSQRIVAGWPRDFDAAMPRRSASARKARSTRSSAPMSRTNSADRLGPRRTCSSRRRAVDVRYPPDDRRTQTDTMRTIGLRRAGLAAASQSRRALRRAETDDRLAGAAARLAALETSAGGRLGVAVLDTGGDARLLYRADERFPMCSTFKALASAAVLKRVDEGQEQLQRVVRYGAGRHARLRAGDEAASRRRRHGARRPLRRGDRFQRQHRRQSDPR